MKRREGLLEKVRKAEMHTRAGEIDDGVREGLKSDSRQGECGPVLH